MNINTTNSFVMLFKDFCVGQKDCVLMIRINLFLHNLSNKCSKYPKWQLKYSNFWYALFNYFLWLYQLWSPRIGAPHFQTSPHPFSIQRCECSCDCFVIFMIIFSFFDTILIFISTTWLTSTVILKAIIQQVNKTALATTFVFKCT